MSEWTDRAEEAAKTKGLLVERPKEDELFIDIDDAASLRDFYRTIGVLGQLVTAFVRAPSPSGKEDRFHIRVTLSRPVRNDFERVALQAMLGSDRLHELLSWQAAEGGVKGVTVFFEKPPTEAATVLCEAIESP